MIKPFIPDEAISEINKVLKSGYLTEGVVTREFENNFSDYIGCKYSIAVTSCTTGLEIALRSIGIKPGDEVIVPDYTYPATADVAPILGVTSVLVDVDRTTMLIDYSEIEKAVSEKTKAIIPVSEFGNPLDYSLLNKLKVKYNLKIIEDAACSLGTEYNNKKVGCLADISVFSFHPRKSLTTGEGGMITTDNQEWADWMKSYKRFGVSKNKNNSLETFEIIGSNYKMSDILAALGLSQIKIFDKLICKKLKLVERYVKTLEKNKKVVLPKVCPKGKHSYQSFCILVENRDQIMMEMKDRGIEVQIGTYALHLHSAFQNNSLIKIKGDLKNSKWVYDHCLSLPLFPQMTFEEQDKVVENLLEILDRS